MSVKIRLRRLGAKNPSEFKVDVEKAKKWLASGAQPTDTVRSLMKLNGIL